MSAHGGTIEVDGRLDEADWRVAERSPRFADLIGGRPGVHDTRAAVLCKPLLPVNVTVEGAVAILLKSEFLLVIVGGVFVAETFSVVIQRSAFKWRKRRFGLEYAQKNRVFLRAPIHHHFELKGWPETQVVVRFCIIGILCAFVALSTLKIR